MITVECKSLFKDEYASIGSHIHEEAIEKDIPIRIKHQDTQMTVPRDKLNKFFTFGKGREYPHTNGRVGTYTLKYIRYDEDK